MVTIWEAMVYTLLLCGNHKQCFGLTVIAWNNPQRRELFKAAINRNAGHVLERWFTIMYMP